VGLAGGEKMTGNKLPAAVVQLVGSGWDERPRKLIACAACNVPVAFRHRRFDKRLTYSGKFVCNICIHAAKECKIYFTGGRCNEFCKVR